MLDSRRSRLEFCAGMTIAFPISSDQQETLSSSRVRKRLQVIGQISDEAKPSGKRSAGKPHAAFDVAGAGNGITVGAH